MNAKLRDPDKDNLALDRLPCPAFSYHGDTNIAKDCEVCEGKLEIIKDTGRSRLSHTRLDIQLNCLRKYQHKYVTRLEPVRKKESLSMGAAFHKAVEWNDPDRGAELLTRDVQIDDQRDYDQALTNMAIVKGAAGLYISTYPEWTGLTYPETGDFLPGKPVVSPSGEKGIAEYEYLVRLRSPYTGRYSQTFDLHGYADKVIDHGGYLEVIENKFVGRITKLNVERVRLDRQISLECYALWRVTGKPVRIIRYRFTKKPEIRQRQAESRDEFIQRVLDDYNSRPDFYTHEERTYRDAGDLLETEQELWDWAEQQRNARQRKFYARNTSHCEDYGGCHFIPLCSGDPDAPSLFKTRPTYEERLAAAAGRAEERDAYRVTGLSAADIEDPAAA